MAKTKEPHVTEQGRLRMTLDLSPDDYNAVERLAQEDQRSKGFIIRKAIRLMVGGMDGKKKS